MTRRSLPYAAAAGVAVAARLPNAWRALTQDEVFSARILREPTLTGMVRHVIRTESTPPLWYLLGWLAHHIGTPVVDVRLLSVAFGGALAAVVLALASTVLSRRYAFVAALLVGLAFEPLTHGAELRSYELLALLASTLGLVLVRSLRSPSRRLDVALGATAWAGLLTHYFFAFSVAATLAWLWLDPQARALRRRATRAIALAGVAAAPWLPGFVAQFRHDHYWWIPRFSARVVLVTPLRIFAPLGVRHLAIGVVVLAVVSSGAWMLARRPEGRAIATLALVPIAFAAVCWAGGLRMYAARNLIETAPFLAVAAAGALASLRRLAVPATAAAVASAGAACLSVIALPQPQYQSIAHALVAAGWRPADPIAVFGNFFSFRAPLEWYLPHGPLLDVSSPTRTDCPAVFVVSPLPDGSFDIDRLTGVPARIRHATLLASMHGASCVRLSHDPHLEPLT